VTATVVREKSQPPAVHSSAAGQNGDGSRESRVRFPNKQKTSQSTAKMKLKKILLQKYKKDVTSDMEVIYTSESNGRQIGSNLLRLIDQIIDNENQESKSFDRDLFIFYSIDNKKIPLKLFQQVMPSSAKIYAKAATVR
jgi:hypothetical protein